MEVKDIILFGKYNFVFLIPAFLSFTITYFALKHWIKIAKKLGFVGKDMNKPYEIYVPESGGIWVSIGLVIGLLTYIFLKTYILNSPRNILETLTLTIVILLSSFLGFIDDILGWKKGLKPWQKVLFTIPIAFPVSVMKFGYSKISLPFIGAIDFGIFYPLVLVPIGIIGAANGFNMIAGYNGLEALMGLILFTNLFLRFLYLGKYWLAFISLLVIINIFAFYIFNKYPSKVFPGDSFTLMIGSLFASLVILGNNEKFGVILFLLYYFEFLLFLRGIKDGIYKENFGKVMKDGTLKEPYKKIYSLTHLAIRVVRKIKGECYEKDVVRFIAFLQILVSILAWLI